MPEETRYGCSLGGFRSALADTLRELGEEYGNLVVVDAETGSATNILSFRERYPDRYITTGVAEQAAISMAFALSRSGLIPVAPLFSCFLTRRACDQIFVQIGYANANVKMIGCYSGLSTPNTGATHQSINEFAILRGIPNIMIVEAADPAEFAQALRQAIAYKGPVFLRMIRGDIPEFDILCTPGGHRFRLGRASVLRRGADVSLVACGLMTPRALKAAEILSERGISAEVVNCSSIKPLDEETIVDSARRTGRVVTAENHSIHGGLGGAVAEVLVRRHPVPMRFVGIEDRYGRSGPLEELFLHFGLTAERIVEKAVELLS